MQMPALARKLAMKTMHAKNRNILHPHSVSQISSSDGWEKHYNEINELKCDLCAMYAVKQCALYVICNAVTAKF